MIAAAPPVAATSSWFQRYLLPGFAFKAVVIGGGYATGRELAEFFLPSGPWGGLAGMILATLIWSGVCALTFAFARVVQAYDYRSFFKALLGPFWLVFEIAYMAFVILILSVFGAAAGAIAAATLGAPPIVGTLALAVAIAGFATFGNSSVERLFKWVSFLLYGVYALFIVLALSGFGDRIAANFAVPAPSGGWALGGLTYASYNIVGAVVILPVIRHLTSQREAVTAGLIAGPLAMIPALLFFVAMIAFYPGIAAETLPSDFLLRQLQIPAFHYLFQLMIFAALLESGCGAVHAINERVDTVLRVRRGTGLSHPQRAMLAATLLVGCIFVAGRFGLVALIGSGYRFLAYVILAVYVVPLIVIGLPRLIRGLSPIPKPAHPLGIVE
ncbi:YkvI family membrane protein [Sphingomonas sp. PB4P5]|uniref:YkvI family membrane protein n=1 Tax=Parasphingomonas puruogangriensis TaxID=3096155 RepID=UPI002FCB6358